MTVWVVADGGHDYSDAARFGEVRFLLPKRPNVFAIGQLVREVEAKLQGVRRGDALLLSGSALACCLVFYAWLQQLGEVQVLIFSFRDQRYELRAVRLEQLAVSSVKLGGTNGEG